MELAGAMREEQRAQNFRRAWQVRIVLHYYCGNFCERQRPETSLMLWTLFKLQENGGSSLLRTLTYFAAALIRKGSDFLSCSRAGGAGGCESEVCPNNCRHDEWYLRKGHRV